LTTSFLRGSATWNQCGGDRSIWTDRPMRYAEAQRSRLGNRCSSVHWGTPAHFGQDTCLEIFSVTVQYFQYPSTRDRAVPATATQICATFSALMKANMDYVFGSQTSPIPYAFHPHDVTFQSTESLKRHYYAICILNGHASDNIGRVIQPIVRIVQEQDVRWIQLAQNKIQ